MILRTHTGKQKPPTVRLSWEKLQSKCFSILSWHLKQFVYMWGTLCPYFYWYSENENINQRVRVSPKPTSFISPGSRVHRVRDMGASQKSNTAQNSKLIKTFPKPGKLVGVSVAASVRLGHRRNVSARSFEAYKIKKWKVSYLLCVCWFVFPVVTWSVGRRRRRS